LSFTPYFTTEAICVSIANADVRVPARVPNQNQCRPAAGMRKQRWVELHFIESLVDFAWFLWISWNLQLLRCFWEAV